MKWKDFFVLEDKLSERTALFLGRMGLLIGGAGLILFGYLYVWTTGLTSYALGNHYVVAAICWGLFGLSFLPQISRKTLLHSIDLLMLFGFPFHSIWLSYHAGFPGFFVITLSIVVQVLFLYTRNSLQVQVFGCYILLTLGGFISLSTELSLAERGFIFSVILVIVLVNALTAEARVRQLKKNQVEKKARQASESTLRSLIASSPDLIWAVDQNLSLRTFNQAFLEFCQDRSSVNLKEGSSLPELMKVLGWKSVPGAIFDQVLKGSPYSEDISLSAKHGRLHYQLSLYPVRQGNKIIGISGFARDLSNWKKMEEALRSSEERYQGLMNSSLSGIMSLQTVRNAAGEIDDFAWTTINEAACQMIPFFHLGIIGKKSREVIPDDELGYFRSLCKWVVESGQPFDQELRVSSPRLQELWIQLSVVRLKDGVAITFLDISERKENERELQKLSLVASHTSNAVIITNEKEEIEWVNESFTKITGYSLEEVQGKLPSSFLQGPDTDQQTLARIRAKINARQAFSEEILNYHKNGTPYWVSMSITPIFDKHGKVSRFISVESDITDRIQTAVELRAAKEAAEAATRAKSEFLATMSHEIRTPMNAVIGLASILAETGLTKEQRDYVETVRISGDNLLTIINDILDYSKIEAGKLELEQQIFCLQERIEVILDLLKERSQRKGLRLSLEIDPAVPAYLISDPTRIGQILMNLIGNGIKFTESGGVSLSVSLHKTEETGQIQKCLYFEVRDTGIGIPPEKLDRLFQSFSQVDASTTRKYGGTGLGLVISKNLIKLMDGKIWVKSETGKGSRFCFLLPLTVPSDDAIAKIQQKNRSITELHQTEVNWPTDLSVLLVEDNVINQKVATRSLNKLGLNADVAGNGLEALGALEIKDYDLIFMDMQMPEMDGLTATREIRRLFPAHEEKPLIIAMTANAMQGDRQRCLDAGMNDYLSKPIKLDDIRLVLRRWYQKQLAQIER